MKIVDCEQGSDEWFRARLGLPTASSFDKIITPLGKPSTQSKAYANLILAELMIGHPVEIFEKTPWMERGSELEADAARFYEMQTGNEITKVGFCTDDNRTVGASPDRLVGDEGLLELKCPAPHTHVEYLLTGKVDMGYWPQLQGQLLVTGRKWVDWVSFHPEMPPVIIRIERDIGFMQNLTTFISVFNGELAKKKTQLEELGYIEVSGKAA